MNLVWGLILKTGTLFFYELLFHLLKISNYSSSMTGNNHYISIQTKQNWDHHNLFCVAWAMNQCLTFYESVYSTFLIVIRFVLITNDIYVGCSSWYCMILMLKNRTKFWHISGYEGWHTFAIPSIVGICEFILCVRGQILLSCECECCPMWESDVTDAEASFTCFGECILYGSLHLL